MPLTSKPFKLLFDNCTLCLCLNANSGSMMSYAHFEEAAHQPSLHHKNWHGLLLQFYYQAWPLLMADCSHVSRCTGFCHAVTQSKTERLSEPIAGLRKKIPTPSYVPLFGCHNTGCQLWIPSCCMHNFSVSSLWMHFRKLATPGLTSSSPSGKTPCFLMIAILCQFILCFKYTDLN